MRAHSTRKKACKGTTKNAYVQIFDEKVYFFCEFGCAEWGSRIEFGIVINGLLLDRQSLGKGSGILWYSYSNPMVR